MKKEPVNFGAELKSDEEKHGIGGGGNSIFYNFKEGNDNILRILQKGEPILYFFIGKGQRPRTLYGMEKGDPTRDENGNYPEKKSVKYIMYAIDRSDNRVKQVEMPYSVMRDIKVLQENPDYQFDSLPMPYDIRVTYDKSESPANMYKVTPIPKHYEVTDEETKDFQEKMDKMTPEDAVQLKKDKQMESDKEAGTWLSPEKIQAEHKENFEESVKKSPKAEPKKTVEYPEEEISVEDIPF